MHRSCQSGGGWKFPWGIDSDMLEIRAIKVTGNGGVGDAPMLPEAHTMPK